MEALASYLNDHLAGSVAALELLDRLIDVSKHNSREHFFRELREEIDADHHTLKEIMTKVGAEESSVRQTAAWVIEKLSRAKLQLNGEKDEENEPGLFLALETLTLGIIGKRLLWRALAAGSETQLSLRGPDYATLEERAIGQRDRVEMERLRIAPNVFNHQ